MYIEPCLVERGNEDDIRFLLYPVGEKERAHTHLEENGGMSPATWRQ